MAFGQVQLAGVMSGVLFDPPSRSVRQVLGVPGGARFGPAILTAIDNAWTSPDGNAVVTLVSGQLSLTRLKGSDVTASMLLGEAPGRFKIVWSRDGKAVVFALLQPDGSTAFQVWRTDQSVPDPQIQSALAFGGIRSIAVSAQTSEILLAVQQEGISGLHRVSFSGEVRLVAGVDQLEAISWDSTGSVVYAFISGPAKLLKFHLPFDAQQQLDIPVPSDVVCPCWLAPAGQGSRLAVAYSNPDRLLIFDVNSTDPPQEVLLEGAPEGLDAYGVAGGLFTLALRRQEASSALLLEVKSGSVFFVPATPPPAN